MFIMALNLKKNKTTGKKQILKAVAFQINSTPRMLP